MGQLEDMAMFVRVVEAGSITKAAEQLNIAKSAVSRRLKELETRLGSQLISRTTRQSNLTQAGEQFPYVLNYSSLIDPQAEYPDLSGRSPPVESKTELRRRYDGFS